MEKINMETVAEKNGFKALVGQDEGAQNPREWSNLGIMVCQHRRYTLGDEQKKNTYDGVSTIAWNSLENYLKKERGAIIVLPLYLYEHSGLRIKVGSFDGLLSQGHAEFDSMQVGVIYATKEAILKEYSVKRISPSLLEKVKKLLIDEVETYDQFLSGDVFFFVIKQEKECNLGAVHEEIVESCGGFYGFEEAKNEAINMLEHVIKERK